MALYIKRTVRMVGECYMHKGTDTVWVLVAIGTNERDGKYKLIHGNVVRWVTSEEFDREFDLFLHA